MRLLAALLFLPTISISNRAPSLLQVALAHRTLAQTEGLMMQGAEAFMGVGLGLDCDCGRLNTEQQPTKRRGNGGVEERNRPHTRRGETGK